MADDSVNLWHLGVCVIFAREFMEGAIIIGEYRTAIMKSKLPEDGPSEELLLRNVTWSAICASLLAIVLVVIVAIPLAVLSKEFNEATADIIEGVSKVVAAICILQLSLKMPKWLGFYKKKNQHGKVDEHMDLTIRSIRFNVAWNIWREVAECGVFLLPFLLQGDDVASIPLSALAGVAIGLVAGGFIYWANQRFENKFFLALFTTLLLVFLSTGLFVGGCHEFEEVWGETRKVWSVQGYPDSFWSHKKLPMVLLKPFGYSASRTVLQIACFWSWLGLSAILHGFMIYRTKKVVAEMEQLAASADGKKLEDQETGDLEKGEEGDSPQTSDAGEDAEVAGTEDAADAVPAANSDEVDA